MSRPNMGKSYIVSTEDLQGGGGMNAEQVQALIDTSVTKALADYAKKADVYTKAEADEKFQSKA